MTDTIEHLTIPTPGDSVTVRDDEGGFRHGVVVYSDEVRVLVATDFDDPGQSYSLAEFHSRTAAPSTPPATFWIELVEYEPGQWAVNRHQLRAADYTPQSRRPNARWVTVAILER